MWNFRIAAYSATHPSQAVVQTPLEQTPLELQRAKRAELQIAAYRVTHPLDSDSSGTETPLELQRAKRAELQIAAYRVTHPLDSDSSGTDTS